MKAELLNLALPATIVITMIIIVGAIYFYKMRSRITVKNQCPYCELNYGQRVQTPFIYDIFRTILSIPVRSYKCLSCGAIFFVK